MRQYLIDHGIAAERLEAEGFGETRPIVPDANTQEDHARNRRVAFEILDSGGANVETTQ